MAEKKTHTITFPDGQVFTVYDKDAQEKITDLYDKIENIEIGDIDLSNYYNKQNTNDLLDLKQNKLVAGNNITIDPVTNIISATGGSSGSVQINVSYDDSGHVTLSQTTSGGGSTVTVNYDNGHVTLGW